MPFLGGRPGSVRLLLELRFLLEVCEAVRISPLRQRRCDRLTVVLWRTYRVSPDREDGGGACNRRHEQKPGGNLGRTDRGRPDSRPERPRVRSEGQSGTDRAEAEARVWRAMVGPPSHHRR